MSFDVLFAAKGADINALMSNPQRLQTAIGVSRDAASRQLMEDWYIITGETRATQQQIEVAHTGFNGLVNQMANFARENRIIFLISDVNAQENQVQRFNSRQAQNPPTIPAQQEQLIQPEQGVPPIAPVMPIPAPLPDFPVIPLIIP